MEENPEWHLESGSDRRDALVPRGQHLLEGHRVGKPDGRESAFTYTAGTYTYAAGKRWVGVRMHDQPIACPPRKSSAGVLARSSYVHGKPAGSYHVHKKNESNSSL